MTTFFRTSLGLPDPHEIIEIFNETIDAQKQVMEWLIQWERTQRTDAPKSPDSA